jgi:formylglycine-generating enzyme required for sulfatase activity
MIRGVAAIEMAKSNAELTLAADEFRRATELDPSLSAAWYNLGSVQAKLGQFDAAIESYKRYLTLVPKAEDAQKVQDEIVKLEFRQELLTKSKQAGKVFKDCADCPEMVVVPAGSFTMGSPASESERDSDEGPQHPVTIARQFAAGKFEVTFDEWDACVRESGCGHNPGDEGWGCGRRPVMNVSWDDAKQYVQWLSRKTGKNYRLLSEAEWEYVARAGTTTAFSWGDSITPQQAAASSRRQTAPVGSYAPNAFGLYDVHGNVWEWTEDCWNGNYNGAPSNGSAWTSGECGLRVLRGGSWDFSPRRLRSAFRGRNDPGNRLDVYGLRVARTN